MPKFCRWKTRSLRREALYLGVPCHSLMSRAELIEVLAEVWS